MRSCSARALVTTVLCVSAVFGVAKSRDHKTIEYKTVEHKVSAPVVYRFSRLAHHGRLVKAQDGKPGLVKEIFKVVTEDGHQISKSLVRKEVVKPKETVFLMANDGFQLTSRHEFTRSKVMTLEATAYAAKGKKGHFWGKTCTGIIAKFGVVAVDPHVIPLGTLLYVEGYGFAKAADIGGAIKGKRIDLCMDSERECEAFGRRPVKVHILAKR